MNSRMTLITVISNALWLTACGGGGGAPAMTSNNNVSISSASSSLASSVSSTSSSLSTSSASTSSASTSSVSSSSGSNANSFSMDDFNRSILGANWRIDFPDNTQVQIMNGSALGMESGVEGFFLATWVGTIFPPDVYCETVISPIASPDWLEQVYVRRRETDGARYGFGYDGDPKQSNFGDWIIKYDGVRTENTRVIGFAPATTIPKPGDALKIEIVGYMIRGYLNGTLVVTAEDTAQNKIADGRPGLASRVATGNAAFPQNVSIFESWQCGAL